MEVGPGHPWYFQKPCLIDFKDKQVSREEHNGSAQHPLPTQGDALPSVTYVLLWMSMAQRQRTTDESSVQTPKVRAWRPFTVQEKQAGVLRRVCQGSLQTPPVKQSESWACNPLGWAKYRLWCCMWELEGMERIPKGNLVQPLFKCLQLGGRIPRIKT